MFHYTCISYFVYRLIYQWTCVVSTCRLSGLELLWTWVCKYLFSYFSYPSVHQLYIGSLGYTPGSGLLRQMGILCLIFPRLQHLFFSDGVSVFGFDFAESLSCWVWSGACLWFWPAFPWWRTMLAIFSCASWPRVYLLWRNVYTSPLSIV